MQETPTRPPLLPAKLGLSKLSASRKHLHSGSANPASTTTHPGQESHQDHSTFANRCGCAPPSPQGLHTCEKDLLKIPNLLLPKKTQHHLRTPRNAYSTSVLQIKILQLPQLELTRHCTQRSTLSVSPPMRCGLLFATRLWYTVRV